jgi:hypothetical protein
MVAEHIFLHAPQSVDDCRDLMNDVETISVRVNHLLQPAHLTFDAAQTRLLPVMFDFNAAMCGLV